MHLRFILFADAANLSATGKLNVVGEFTGVVVPQLPGLLARASIVVRLELSVAEASAPHHIRLAVAHRDSPAPLFQAEAVTPVVAAASAPGGAEAADVALTQVYDIVGLLLPQLGGYVATVTADGQAIGEAALVVIGLDGPGAGSAATPAATPAAPGPPGAK